MPEEKTCRTCQRWGYHFEEDPDRRTCILLGSPMSKQTGQAPGRNGNAGVRTDADFACAEHTPDT